MDISPFDEQFLGAASYDLLLDNMVRVVNRSSALMDLSSFDPGYSQLWDLNEKPLILHPGGCLLASTQETISVSNGYGCQIEGRSSMARLFQSVHVTAGWCDPGWSGKVTLEIVNHLPRPVIYKTGLKIGQALFFRMTDVCDSPYESKGQYQGQATVTEANPIKIFSYDKEAV